MGAIKPEAAYGLSRSEREHDDASVGKFDVFSNYSQAQSGQTLFALVESIRHA
jgi:hypothetical protein